MLVYSAEIWIRRPDAPEEEPFTSEFVEFHSLADAKAWIERASKETPHAIGTGEIAVVDPLLCEEVETHLYDEGSWHKRIEA